MTQEELEASSLRGPDDELAPLGDAAPTVPAAPPSPVAPNPAAAFDTPEYGPPAPDPTDAIAAKLPPAPGGIPTRDGGAEWPPAVPGQASGNVGSPGSPIPQAPEAIPGTTADVKDAMGKEKDAREEALKAQQDQLEAGQDIAGAKDEAATARSQAAAESVKHAEAIQAQYDKADAAAAQQIQQTQAALKNFKFKDYWADKSSAQRVISSLGVALGALGSGLTKTPNYALQILDKEMDRDHQAQVDNLNQLSDQAVQAHTGLQDSRAARTKAMADLTLADAGKDKLIASQLEEAAARSGDQNYKNVLTAQAAKLREESQGKEVEASKMLRTMNLADQHAQIEAEHLKAQDEYLKQHGEYFEKGGAKGHRGSGTGVGGGGDTGTISQYIKDHPDDQPGAYKLAERLGYHGKKGVDLVDKLQNDYKTGKSKKDEDESTVVRDDNGKPIGRVPTGKGGAQGFATRDADYSRAQEQLEALQKDIDENGSRVFLPSAVKRRNTLMHNAGIGVATVSPLGKTDEAMKAEMGSIGEGGSWSLMGANPEAVTNKINELKTQRQKYRNETLIPMKADEAARYQPDAQPTRQVGPGGKPFDATPRDPAKMDRARKAIASKSATPDQKANATAYLRALGESP